MYLPQHFEEAKTGEFYQIVRAHPLGALVVCGANGLDANHLPFELLTPPAENATLRAHVARANPVWHEVRSGDEVLVIFRAAEGYISPNWYPSKHELHRQVPTWNYQVVHVHGQIQIHDDEKFVRGVVARLTREHEGRAGQERPWKMTDSDPAYIDAMLKAIVGIEIDITRIVGKSKLSQNKEVRDRLGAAQGLQELGSQSLADAMQATLPDTD
jgi:transcriptional regulator